MYKSPILQVFHAYLGKKAKISLGKLENKFVIYTGPKMFCFGPNILSQPKNLIAFSASSKTFVLPQKKNLLNATHHFVLHKIFVTATVRK